MFKDNNNLYKNMSDTVFLTRIGQLDIPFDRTWKRIGVNLSGGADSALLTYLLCKIIVDNKLDTKIDVITYQRCWETRPWQGHVSRKVYAWFLDNFADIINDRHTAYIPPEIEHGVVGPF
jgi:tRNA(Ile)-lysidine synthase TilS/MesJ